MPTPPPQFSAHIECVITDKNMTTDLNEYYDDTGNRGAVHQLDLGLELDAWYDYNVNEFIYYYKPSRKCQFNHRELDTCIARFGRERVQIH